MKTAEQPELVDRAPRLVDGEVDVLQRDGRRREQPVGRVRAELGDPVVVGAVHVGDELRIAHRGDRVERPEASA